MPEFQIPDFEEAEVRPPRLVEGTYTVNVREEPTYDGSQADKPFISVKYVVMDGPKQADGSPAVDRATRDRFYLTKKAGWRVKAFLVAAGRMTRDDKSSPIGKGRLGTAMWLGATVKVNVTHRAADDGKVYLDFEYITD